MCLEQHAYYFRLVSQGAAARLEELGLLDPKTLATVSALGSRRLNWLSGIPTDILVSLRRDQGNVTFRQRLAASIDRLQATQLEDIDRVAAEVCHDIEVAIAEYEKEVADIRAKYKRIHAQTALLGVAAAGAALIPALAPLLGVSAPLGLAAKYGHDKLDERAEIRDKTRSVVGVLAAAKSE